MKKVIVFYFAVLFMSLHVYGQKSEMRISNNFLDTDFQETSKERNLFLQMKASLNDLTLMIEKKDSILSTYIFNSYKDSVQIPLQDYAVYTILEAKDNKGKWKPIEYWISSDCGNSYSYFNLASNQILKSNTILKKEGSETSIRMKFLFKNKLFYSNTIKARVSENMWIIPKNIDRTWPLPIAEVAIPKELVYKVVFLEPDGNEEFFKLVK